MNIIAIKQRTFTIIEKAEQDDIASRLFDITIVSLILLNVVAVILSSFSEISQKYYFLLRIFEIVSVTIFSIEYILRLWTSTIKYPNIRPIYSVVCYSISFMALIDLAAILPFYLPMLIHVDLRFLRILRVTRILRILKLNRYSEALKLIGLVFNRRSKELLITVFVTFLLILMSASIMYYFENDAQPKQFPNIIASLWWAVATITTVGYGDIYPITIGGKIIGGIIALLGIGLVALPAGIISSGFLEEMQQRKENNKNRVKVCPHCGKPLNLK